MAHQLMKNGERIALLVFMDTLANPFAGRSDERESDAMFFARLVREQGASVPVDEIRRLAPDEQMEAVLDVARRADIFPPGADLPRVKRLVAVYRANEGAARRYAPPFSLSRITLLRARGHASERSSAAAGEPAEEAYRDPTLGWGALSAHPVEVHEVPGSHESMLREPHVRALAERLERCFHGLR
jgi:thioesterase domain-containing protein